MIRDQGPRQNIGFGVPPQPTEETSSGSNTILSSKLDGHPVMRFFATAAASITAMAVSGAVIRGGGIKLTDKLIQYAQRSPELKAVADRSLTSFRRIEDLLDSAQGVTRYYNEGTPDAIKLLDGKGRRLKASKVEDFDNFRFRAENDDLPAWTAREEIQKRMVRQARRLPYELPGFYVAQKTVIDPLMGNNEDKKVNWSNPFDVIGDFANESLKNIAINLVPFDAAMGAGKHSINAARLNIARNTSNPKVQDLENLLGMVGASVADVTNSTIRFGTQFSGAFSHLFADSAGNAQGFRQFVKGLSTQSTHARKSAHPNQGAARRQHGNFDVKEIGTAAIDSMPGPFKGMGSSISSFKRNFKDIGETFDLYQDVINGRRSLSSIRKGKNGEEAYEKVLALASKNGGSFIESYAKSIHTLGGSNQSGSGATSLNAGPGSLFYNTRRDDLYKRLLVNNLASKTGITEEQALSFVRKAQTIDAYKENPGNPLYGFNIVERFKFAAKDAHPGNRDEWWQDLIENTNAHGIKFKPGEEGKKAFVGAVRLTDSQFDSPQVRGMLSKSTKDEWSHLYGSVIPEQAFRGMPKAPINREIFSDANLKSKSKSDFLIRKAATSLGFNAFDDSGSALPIETVKNFLRQRSFDPNNLKQLRGLLSSKGEITSPWTKNGAGLFGFKSLSVGEGLRRGFYSPNDQGTVEAIEGLAKYQNRKAAQTLGTSSNIDHIKMGKVFTHSSGVTLDLGRVGRGLTKFGDILSSETKIPIVGFNPAQVMGHHFFQAQRRAPAIQMVSSLSKQPFVAGTQDDSFMMWMKEYGKRSKGRAIGVQSSITGGVTSNYKEGLYRSLNTNSEAMVGRYARILTGDLGIPSSNMRGEVLPGTEKNDISYRERLKRLFDVSFDQDSAIFGSNDSLIKRILRASKGSAHKEKLTNPHRAAGGLFDPANSTLTREHSQGISELLKLLSDTGISPKALRGILSDPKFAHITNSVKGLNGRNVFDIPEGYLPRLVEEVLGADAETFRGITDSALRRTAMGLQTHLKSQISQGKGQANFFDLPASRSAQALGSSRRIDQLRNEFSDYLFTSYGYRQAAAGGQATPKAISGSFDQTVGDLFSKVEQMFKAGTISSKDRVHARASILGLQVDFQRANAFRELTETGQEFSTRQVNQELANALRKGPQEVRDALMEISQFKIFSGDSTLDRTKPFFRNITASSTYSKPFEVNPIGDDKVLVPTFGTLLSRKGAARSVSGLDGKLTAAGSEDRSNIVNALRGISTTWSDPNAISGASVASTHVAFRLNRYMETFGLGLDPTRYKGPLDFYSTGLVGRRVLPLVAAGTTFTSIDRTMGGLVNQDAEGNPVYTPLVTGALAEGLAKVQIAGAGIIPGGMTASEKAEQIYEGEVPIRRGRYWILGSTEFSGDRIQYFRPSWYRRLKGAGTYTPEMNETPMERLAFGYDYSPLRPLDPYRFERENYNTRPYPVSGDYFTGPWGPLTPALNATIGRVLKPKVRMHEEEMQQALSSYRLVGDQGAFMPSSSTLSPSAEESRMRLSGINSRYSAAATGPTHSSSILYPAMGYTYHAGRASEQVRGFSEQVSNMYSSVAQNPGTYVGVFETLAPYGVPVRDRAMSPRVVSSLQPLNPGSLNYQTRNFGYRVEEMAGIYGFGLGSIRGMVGIGSGDYTPDRSVLESASRGTSSARAFWNLNLGGAGDFPLPLESRFSNIEISEIARRFVPNDQAGVNYINHIPNLMGQQYPWLPGEEYPLNSVKTGDPYGFPDAEIRLPGTGYRRLNMMFPEQGGVVNAHHILSNVAPWSDQYSEVNKLIGSGEQFSEMAQAQISRTRAQVEAMRIKTEFTPYEYKYSSAVEIGRNPLEFAFGRTMEWAQHRDTWFNSKFMRNRTAMEDWERENVYGSSFPTWQDPIESFVKPYYQKSTQRNVLTTMGLGSFFGAMFGSTPRTKAASALLVSGTATGASLYGSGYEAITGNRYMPTARKQQLALEEHIDILSYTKAKYNEQRALQIGDQVLAQEFAYKASSTMYGANLDGTPEEVLRGVPERRRQHLESMMYAPDQEKEQILSTAPRLERRILQAAWGMQVEARPDLGEYFENHELPDPSSEFWSPLVDMNHVKIKIGQNQGIDMSQMGFYPQQVKEANMVNPAYPRMHSNPNGHRETMARLRMMLGQGANVMAAPNPFGSNQFELYLGG